MKNVDSNEIEKFNRLAHQWWDLNGQCKPLHELNPIRLNWIIQIANTLKDKTILDIGCGGGILSEAMAQSGGKVTGIDLSKDALSVASLHSLESGINVEYQASSAEAWAAQTAQQYDIVTCMEMLEHVPNPEKVIEAASILVKPNGYVFFSTINRNLKAYIVSILGAEYIAKIIPKGTHNYDRLIKPSELARFARKHHLNVLDISGITYHFLTRIFQLSKNTDINYLMACQKIT